MGGVGEATRSTRLVKRSELEVVRFQNRPPIGCYSLDCCTVNVSLRYYSGPT